MPAARSTPPSRPDLACVILAAGKGTRMNSARSKVLHRLLGKPLISYPVDRARELGAAPVIAVLGHQIEAVQDSDVLEASTPQLDDLVRLEDRYGRGSDPCK